MAEAENISVEFVLVSLIDDSEYDAVVKQVIAILCEHWQKPSSKYEKMLAKLREEGVETDGVILHAKKLFDG